MRLDISAPVWYNMLMPTQFTNAQIEQIHQAYLASPLGREEFAAQSTDILGFEVALGSITDWIHDLGWGREKEKARRLQEIEKLNEIGDELGVVRAAAYQSVLDLSASADASAAKDLASAVRSFLLVHDVDKGRDMKQGEYVTRDQAVLIALDVAEEMAHGPGAN